MINPDVAMTFLDFVKERHRIWELRQAGAPQPWTDDPILATRKFTNVFRLLDPGSQFVITNLMCDDPDTFLIRCFLYRHTNLPEAWRAYARDTGEYPDLDNLDDVREFWLGYAHEGGRVFSGAYMIYPQSSVPGTNKIDSIIDLTKRVRSGATRFDFLNTDSQANRFMALKTNKGVADFMSMQILTDFGYSTEFRENDFVVPGPGAVKGAAWLDPDVHASKVLEWAFSAVLQDPPLLQDRPPSRMDVQNCLCEFSKYMRYSSGQKPYAPAHPGVQSAPVIPRHWV